MNQNKTLCKASHTRPPEHNCETCTAGQSTSSSCVVVGRDRRINKHHTQGLQNPSPKQHLPRFYLYLYLSICICVCVYIYMYIYMRIICLRIDVCSHIFIVQDVPSLPLFVSIPLHVWLTAVGIRSRALFGLRLLTRARTAALLAAASVHGRGGCDYSRESTNCAHNPGLIQAGRFFFLIVRQAHQRKVWSTIGGRRHLPAGLNQIGDFLLVQKYLMNYPTTRTPAPTTLNYCYGNDCSCCSDEYCDCATTASLPLPLPLRRRLRRPNSGRLLDQLAVEASAATCPGRNQVM